MNNQQEVQQSETNYQTAFLNHKDTIISAQATTVDFKGDKSNRDTKQFVNDYDDVDSIQDAEEYQEVETSQKPLSLEDMERQMIRSTLDKYKGKRKAAADELQISERTLYRKIKEYGIE